MEVLRGFIRIPVKSRFELIGNASLPCLTTLNGSPARLDKQGRLWSSYLKNNFSINEEVALDKTESGYQVMPVNNTKSLTSDVGHRANVMLLNADIPFPTVSSSELTIITECLRFGRMNPTAIYHRCERQNLLAEEEA
jgi:hypothetical protein